MKTIGGFDFKLNNDLKKVLRAGSTNSIRVHREGLPLVQNA